MDLIITAAAFGLAWWLAGKIQPDY